MVKSQLLSTTPFTAWIRNGEKYQNFNIQGIQVPPSEKIPRIDPRNENTCP